MKRSSHIRLLLLGGISTGAFSGCSSKQDQEPRISPESVYSNDYFVEGAGFYHAPFHGFYPKPYNAFDAARKQYFYGGQWGPAPHRSVINVSAPTREAANAAEAARMMIERSGFGSTGRGSHIWS